MNESETVVGGRDFQSNTSEFSPRERARLSAYRAAVVAGFYTDELPGASSSTLTIDKARQTARASAHVFSPRNA